MVRFDALVSLLLRKKPNIYLESCVDLINAFSNASGASQYPETLPHSAITLVDHPISIKQ
jgi:hypothetical protein